jgi:hypothetical protein
MYTERIIRYFGGSMSPPALHLVPPPSNTTTDSPSTTELPNAPVVPLVERVPTGKLIEISGGAGTGFVARTTLAVAMLRAAQREGETAAWIQVNPGTLYPPDLRDSGIDLEALAVLHVPQGNGRKAHAPLLKAAELLLRSGAFGLVVLDMRINGAQLPSVTSGWAGRLLGLARQHESRVLLLTDKQTTADSLGPLVGIRLEPRRKRQAKGVFSVDLEVLKNKSGTPLQVSDNAHELVCRGPWGLV